MNVFSRINRTLVIAITFIFLAMTGCYKEEILIEEGPVADLISANETLVSWETDLPGTSKILYGKTSSLGNAIEDGEERQNHSLLLKNLEGEQQYYYKVSSYNSRTESTVESEIGEFFTGENETSLTQKGWIFLMAGNLDSADVYFSRAYEENPHFLEPLVGFGWISIEQNDFIIALSRFNNVLYQDSNNKMALLGKATISLLENRYVDAVDDAQRIIDLDAEFQYQFVPEIDWKDVRLILAEAKYALGNLEEAQLECDLIDPDNGLDNAIPVTWTVNGVTYSQYDIALLELISYLNTIY